MSPLINTGYGQGYLIKTPQEHLWCDTSAWQICLASELLSLYKLCSAVICNYTADQKHVSQKAMEELQGDTQKWWTLKWRLELKKQHIFMSFVNM